MSNYGPLHTSPTGAFTRVCEHCGQKFRTDNARQRYCSNACKRSAQNRRFYGKRKRFVAVMRYADWLTGCGDHEPSEIG